MMSDERKSLVRLHYTPFGPTATKCGYCKSESTFLVEAVWAYRMTCQDYQTLVDRGFQRSGKFVYRPIMKETCCPQYVIRTDTATFKPSKSQRYAVRKFHRYLQHGRTQLEAASVSGPGPDVGVVSKKRPRPGDGADPTKPPARKAKIIRQENKKNKLKPVSTPQASSTDTREQVLEHSLAELISPPDNRDCVHKFEKRLVKVDRQSEQFQSTEQESYELFRKFQMVVHKETPDTCNLSQFHRFIVDSPLLPSQSPPGMSCDYGSYHQQYLIDGKLVAVGVLDILPRGVLCEYFYYDPDYRFLNPGVYSALGEISLTQQCYSADKAMQYYYMGYYVQSCPKMNYKSSYSSSSLLCPETLSYVPLEVCVPRLMSSPYSRLAPDSVPGDDSVYSEEQLNSVVVFTIEHNEMAYGTYKTLCGEFEQLMIEQYAALVGLELATSMTLHIEPLF